MENETIKITRECTDDETSITLKKILSYSEEKLSCRIFIFATGQSKKFFRNFEKENKQFLIHWYGNLSGGFTGFILGFIPSYMGIIEVLKPVDSWNFEEFFYECGPSLVTVIVMQDNDKIKNFIECLEDGYNQEKIEQYILQDQTAVILTVGIGDVPPDKNYEEITTRKLNLLTLDLHW